MGVETVLYLDNRLDESVATTTLTASSTANGYSIQAVRRPDWKTAWKPSDSAVDEWLQVDGPSQSWLGTTGGDDIYTAVAYDARGCDQAQVEIYRESSEGSGVWTSPALALNLSSAGPAIAIGFFNLSSGGRTRYRLMQLNADRGGGTKTVRIFGWALYAVGGYYTVGTDDANTTGAGGLRLIAHTGRFRGLTRQVSTNRNGAPTQEFDLAFQPGSEALFEKLRDEFFGRGGAGKPFFIQFQGLENPGQANVGLVRLDASRYDGARDTRDEYDMTIPLRTEAFV